jgi:RNA polymerase sigma-32 factor
MAEESTGKKPRAKKAAKGPSKKGKSAAQVVEAEILPRGRHGDAQDDEDAEDREGEGEPVELGEELVAAVPELDDDGEAEVKPLDARVIEGDVQPASTRGIGRVDPLTRYMQEIRRYPLLTREEEQRLSREFVATGDPELAKRLVTANLRLVVKIAHEYRRAHRNLLDLVQEGNIGLMQAVRKYDPLRGVKLSSYAAWWIRAYILKFILNNWRLVKIGTTQAQRKLFFNLRKEKEKLERLGFAPDLKLLAERLDVTEAEVSEMDQRLAAGDASLDAPLGSSDDGDSRTRMDVMEHGDVRPDVAAERSQFQQILREKLETFAAGLEGRDATLFRERWLSDEPKTLQELGDSFGISRERARQLERRMLDKLRVYLEAELGSAVDIGSLAED